MPNCGQRVGWADLDHVIPHSCGGPTSCTNLCCLCRTDHRLKTFARGWRFVMDPDGTLHVTTPSGVTRTTRPPGLRPPPPEHRPTRTTTHHRSHMGTRLSRGRVRQPLRPSPEGLPLAVDAGGDERVDARRVVTLICAGQKPQDGLFGGSATAGLRTSVARWGLLTERSRVRSSRCRHRPGDHQRSSCVLAQ